MIYGLIITKLNHVSCMINIVEIAKRTCHDSRYFGAFLVAV